MIGCFVFIQTPGNEKIWIINRKLNSGSNTVYRSFVHMSE